MHKSKYYYPLEININDVTRLHLCCKSREQRNRWKKEIYNIIGYDDITLKYTLQEIVGKGSFGVVYKAKRIADNKIFAIKQINKNLPYQKMDQIKKEIKILRLCDHPSIVKVIDVFENKTTIWIVMEYLSGGSLLSKLDSLCENCSEHKIKMVFLQIAKAVYYLQELGIIHRDIKLENIIFQNASECNIKLIDFGLSSIQGHYQDANLYMGTLNYVAPEIIQRRPYGNSIDIWSLGVLLFAMISGSLPFHSANEDKISQ